MKEISLLAPLYEEKTKIEIEKTEMYSSIRICRGKVPPELN